MVSNDSFSSVRLYLRFTDARVTDKDDLYGDELGVYVVRMPYLEEIVIV